MPQDPPRITIFATAMTSGLLLALAAHVLSGRFGIGLTSVWQDLFPTDANALRSTLGWWLILAVGFIGSFLAGLLVQDFARSPRPRPRLKRFIAVVFFLALAGAPFLATTPPPTSPPITLGVNLAVFALGAITAFCGSWFAMAR